MFLWGHELASSFRMFRLQSSILQMMMNISPAPGQPGAQKCRRLASWSVQMDSPGTALTVGGGSGLRVMIKTSEVERGLF